MKEKYPADDVAAMVASALEHCALLDEARVHAVLRIAQGLATRARSSRATRASPPSGPTCRCISASPRRACRPRASSRPAWPSSSCSAAASATRSASRSRAESAQARRDRGGPKLILADIAAGRVPHRRPSSTITRLNIIPARVCSRVENENVHRARRSGKGDDRLREAPRDHDRGHGLPRERPRRDRRCRSGPLVRPHPREPQEAEGPLGAFTYEEILPKLRAELDALIAARSYVIRGPYSQSA